jgi:hypothetical protein
MNTYFIRHTEKLDVNGDTRRQLWEGHRIAIHYPENRNGKLKSKDNPSREPSDYRGKGKSCVKILNNLADTGGYVCAQYYQQEKLMLGIVRPNSKITLLKGKWGTKNGRQGRQAVLKTLHLTKVKFVEPINSAVLLVGRPQQGTIMRWHRAGDAIENLIKGRRTKRQLSDLHYTQQEILCSEFLRLSNSKSFDLPRLAHLLLPPGHTMKDIDIIGIATDGKKLLAQVTFKSLKDCHEKFEQLLPYRNPRHSHLLFFCDCDDSLIKDGVRIFPIRKAYDIFTSTLLGKFWLRHSV